MHEDLWFRVWGEGFRKFSCVGHSRRSKFGAALCLTDAAGTATGWILRIARFAQMGIAYPRSFVKFLLQRLPTT